MAEYIIFTVYRRMQPSTGWLRFFLLFAALTVVIAAALEVGWVPEDRAIVPAAFLGFIFALWLAERRISSLAAWLILLAGGLGWSIYLLARLKPPLTILIQGNPAVAQYWEQNMALFIDRLGGWVRAVSEGGRSTETMVFAFGLVSMSWLLGAFLGWTTGRLDKATWGLAALGLALALTGYFGRAGAYWLVAFVGLATVAIAVAQYSDLESLWERSGTDYSGEVRVELLMYAAAASLILMTIAYALPVINIRAIAENFRRQPAVAEAEDTLQRVFAGVEQPRPAVEEVSAGATIGVLPRSFLLGSAPELLETVVMTATVSLEPQEAGIPPGFHWRALSYDIYTGRGWLRSPEREEVLAAGEQLPLPDSEANATAPISLVTQNVQLIESNETARYMLGRFLSSTQESTVHFRGIDDLVRVRDAVPGVLNYETTSRASLPVPEQLREARLEDVPPEILARYTQLPDNLPRRVVTLAEDVVRSETAILPAEGQLVNPSQEESSQATLSYYDQARAIENFLHQYPYSLEVGLPPSNVDMVDYFLFELQTGFCDYYASAMVVMARSLGIPARLGTGFLPQAADPDGQQLLRQKDSHSWAEIYFPGHGWVEFEPTASIPGQESAMAQVAPYGYGPDAISSSSTLVAIPQREPERKAPLPLIVAFALTAVLVGGFWLRRWVANRNQPFADLDEIQSAYNNLQIQAGRLGYTPLPTQTPFEYAEGLEQKLETLDTGNLRIWLGKQKLARMAALYSRRQYGQGSSLPRTADSAEAQALWAAIRPQLVELASPWRAIRRALGR